MLLDLHEVHDASKKGGGGGCVCVCVCVFWVDCPPHVDMLKMCVLNPFA